jgi:hypothetical protein
MTVNPLRKIQLLVSLHLNYSTTNINKTHDMSLGVVLQLEESLPQISTVRKRQYCYGTLSCQIVVTLVCFTVQRQIIKFTVSFDNT